MYLVGVFSRIPARRAKECPFSSQKLGVTMGLESVENSETQQTYFHADLAKKGFVPQSSYNSEHDPRILVRHYQD